MKPIDKDELITDEMEDENSPDESSLEDRKKDYSTKAKIAEHLTELYASVEKGFEDKKEQSNITAEAWNCYNCELSNNQAYYGTSEMFVPIIRDALSARETRFINMLFPQAGRYADVAGHDGKTPYDLIAMLDDYVKKAKLRQKVMPALIRTGDISGTYALYMEWIEKTRHVTTKTKVAEKQTELGTDIDGSPEFDDVDHLKVVDQYPDVTVLDPSNVVVLPATAETIDDADVVGIRLKFSKSKIKKYMKDGIFEKKAGKALLENLTKMNQLPDPAKQSAQAAGVRLDSKGSKSADIFQVWSKIKIGKEERLMVTHFGSPELILGCKRNPYWCDRIPVILQPVEPNPGTVWGNSQVAPVMEMQYAANDAANEGADSSQYALMPIVMTDPEKNPRAGSMVLAMASVWLTNPNDTKFAEFPALWKDALTLVGAYKEQIFQSLGVNPAMIPHGNAGKKPSQAQIAQEQQVALESSADNIALIQEGILSQILEWFYELDYQYRTEAITVKKYGQFGLQATMDQVEPWQVRDRYEFRWYGTEAFKSTQQVQQMISWANVLRGTPPDQLNGRKVDIGPMLEHITEITCGPRLASYTLIDKRHQLTMNPEMENQLIDNMFPVQVHEMDDDQAHIQSHFQHFQEYLQTHPGQDKISELARGHILSHIENAKKKAMQAMGAQPGLPGTPGGAGPGLPGQPRPGSANQMPSGPQGPPGVIRPDAMATQMPRKSAL